MARAGINVAHWDLLPTGATIPTAAFARPAPYVEAGTYAVTVSGPDGSAETVFTVVDG
jgi:hypothetical protein